MLRRARCVRFTAATPCAVPRKKRFERPPRSGVGSPEARLDVPLRLQTIKGGKDGTD